jgi:HAND
MLTSFDLYCYLAVLGRGWGCDCTAFRKRAAIVVRTGDSRQTEGLKNLKGGMYVFSGANWVDPPKRERKRVVNYAENEYYRQAMKVPGGGRGGGPRLPKMPALQDFQFFNVQRLTELFEKEGAFESFKHAQAQKEAAARAQVRHCLRLVWQEGTTSFGLGMSSLEAFTVKSNCKKGARSSPGSRGRSSILGAFPVEKRLCVRIYNCGWKSNSVSSA